jgi:IS5 family transposase
MLLTSTNRIWGRVTASQIAAASFASFLPRFPTAANVHDKHPLADLLHGQVQRVWGDSAYSSQQALIRSKAPQAADWTNQRVRKGSAMEDLERLVNRIKSKVRARVEHVFAVVKRPVGLRQSALPWLGQERHAILRRAGAGQHLPRAWGTV